MLENGRNSRRNIFSLVTQSQKTTFSNFISYYKPGTVKVRRKWKSLCRLYCVTDPTKYPRIRPDIPETLWGDEFKVSPKRMRTKFES